QSGEVSSHGQAPASWVMTCRAGSPRGSLTDRRSWLRTLALHPVSPSGSSGTPHAAGLMRAVKRPAHQAVATGARKSIHHIEQTARAVKCGTRFESRVVQ